MYVHRAFGGRVDARKRGGGDGDPPCRQKDIRGCIDCRKCRQTGKCVFDDIVNETAQKFEAADGIVIGSPVYYAGANGAVCAVLDRAFYVSKNRLAHKPGAAW